MTVSAPSTHGSQTDRRPAVRSGSPVGLTLEIAATAAGLLVGLCATRLTQVYRSPGTGRAVSRAGFGYAALWTAVVGARSAFSYGADHWFGPQLGHRMASHQVTSDVLTDALVLTAVAMMLTRTLTLAARAATTNRLAIA